MNGNHPQIFLLNWYGLWPLHYVFKITAGDSNVQPKLRSIASQVERNCKPKELANIYYTLMN